MAAMSAGDVVAVILAGGGARDRLARSAGVASKALVPFHGVALGVYVASALRASGAVRRIVLVGESDDRLAALVDAVVPSGERLVDSLALGLGAALGAGRTGGGSGVDRVIVATSDIPWWRAEGVRSFLAEAPDADIVYPVVPEAAASAAFPDQRRTYLRLREGRFTGGNAVLLRPPAVAPLLPWVDVAFRARKRPLQLAAMVGWGTLASILRGQAALADIEARVRTLTGIDARAMVSSDAAIAADVDAPEHLASTTALPPLDSPTEVV
jgi:molybdopterin-guanine dinucleotide biosynthesis protein A